MYDDIIEFSSLNSMMICRPGNPCILVQYHTKMLLHLPSKKVKTDAENVTKKRILRILPGIVRPYFCTKL